MTGCKREPAGIAAASASVTVPEPILATWQCRPIRSGW